MKRLLSLAVILSMLVIPIWGWSYTEATKKLCVPETKICVTLPEKAPDFIGFNAQVLASRSFDNGNQIKGVEFLNKELTVDVIAVVAFIGEDVSIVMLQVSYAPEGFDKFDASKTHQTDYFEDVGFTKHGKPSGQLVRVDKLTSFEECGKFIAGGEI